MFIVYVLINPDDRLYVGQTGNLHERLAMHKSGQAGWTRSRGPWRLAHTESYATQGEAMKREKALKTGRLNQRLRQLIQSHYPTVERVLPRKD
jgi:putative endonuclease